MMKSHVLWRVSLLRPAACERMRVNKAAFVVMLLLTAVTLRSAVAQDDIPTTSGFSGYGLVAPGYFNVQSSLLVTGTPLLADVGTAQIESIFEAPTSGSVPALVLGLELNYTNASTRTQLFFGNRIEDILRLDIAFGLGIRQELGDMGILAVSALLTPTELKFWADPYVEGEDRQPTSLDYPGARLRWGRILKTGLELTGTFRQYRHGEENSGNWLIEQGRLDPAQKSLLARDGNIIQVQALYRIDVKRHRFEPAVRYINDDHDGAALAKKGFSLQLTYLYREPKFVLDANLVFGHRKADAVHPIYDETLTSDRWGVAFKAFIPIRPFKRTGWSIFVGGEIFQENVNVDFFDSRIGSIDVGVLWRHRRP